MNLISLSILVCFAAGLVSLILFRKIRKLQWIVFFISALFMAAVSYRLFGLWGTEESYNTGIFSLSLKNSYFGWIFFAMTSIVTLLISVFSLSYNDKKHATAIAPLWTMLLGANAGIFFAADWITFIIAWEIMGWTSFFIISHGKLKSFKAGIYYYALSMIGAVTLLAAVFILSAETGTMEISASIKALSALWGENSSLVYTVTVLFAVTFLAKSAAGPFYMWPAKAHAEAPDDFSSFLSGIMIKYGIFGILITIVPLFRFSYTGPLVWNTPLALYILGWIGALTAVSGMLLAVRENDMKRMMAFSTVSNIGFILLAVSVNTTFGIAAAVFHTFNHMVFKGTIFLSMASVKFRTGEREMHRLGGIGYKMPVAFFAFLIGIISAAGIPPMAGFGSKWMIFQSLFGQKMLFLAIPGFLASTGAFLYLYRGLHAIYLGQLSPRFDRIKPAPPLQSISMALMMLSIFVVGAYPGIFLIPIREAAASFTGGTISADLTSISGITSNVNLLAVSATFIASFLLVLFLYIIGKKRSHVEPLDSYMSGEYPEDWDMIPEQYHYAFRFYEPFEKMMNPSLEMFSFENWFENIIYNIKRFSVSLGRWFYREQPGTFIIITALTLIILTGVVW